MIRNYLVPSALSLASVRPTRKTGEKPSVQVSSIHPNCQNEKHAFWKTQVSCESINEHSWAPKPCMVNYLPCDSIDAENCGVVLRKSMGCQIKKKDEGF